MSQAEVDAANKLIIDSITKYKVIIAGCRDLQLETYTADWKAHGRAAGPIRNAQMASVAHALIAFWDGKSRETKNMIDTATKRGLQVAVVRY